ncbi:PhzF family phenazine biosynthesis protein [Actinomyces sp.]|uniref:PhzF family phenazine biosynthesis protein n=1 Tax=Actinomyces sp. TaxID=29317 RepID=UPI0026DCB66F|nr:PhzF family phenazine biosynthesis protein [Actinomyces sp.]MDO4899563.1 PhzF family phenazine biosynthesis protein [Actinomyces sp.]
MRQFVVDAFTDRPFAGNPAAVCLPETWPADRLMEAIARENNLSETAFCVREGEAWRLRWFTPGGEIDLCGHATLATAHVLLAELATGADAVSFETLSGRLTVRHREGRYEMDFPAYRLRRLEVTDQMVTALGARPSEAWMGRDLLCVFDDEATVRGLTPDLRRVEELPGPLCHATAPGSEFDCVSRSFAPSLGIAEDPVCGSGHCHIAPYWAEQLGKPRIRAWQASARGGELLCVVDGERCALAGAAVTFLRGEIVGL